MTEEDHLPDGGTADAEKVSLPIGDPITRPGTDGVQSVVSEVDRERETVDGEVEPVEVLVQLAEDGEIEPWDIDIVAVTDAFLERLDAADLRTGGRALFYASVLLRMKSDALLEEPEPAEPEPWEMPADPEAAYPPEAGAGDPFPALEAEIDRRIKRKRARGMPRTLDELVHELRERERWWKASREYDTSESPRGFARGTQTLEYRGADDLRLDDEPTEAEVTGTAHAEHMDEIVDAVHAALRDQFDAGRAEVLFAEVDEVGGSRVESFLAVLFLAHREQVYLHQDDLFGDLWIQDPAGEAVTAPAATE